MRSPIFHSLSTRFSVVVVVVLILITSLSGILSIVKHYLILENAMQSKGQALMRNLSYIANESLKKGDLPAIQRFITNTAGEDDVVFITLEDSEGRILACQDQVRIGSIYPDPVQPPSEQISQNMSMRRETDRDSGKDVLVIRSTLPDHGSYRVRIGMTRVPLRESILVSYQYYLSKVMLIGLIGIFISVIISQKITNPLRVLVEDVQKIAAGDLTKRITPTADDEIGQLASAFEEMRTSLKHKIGELDAMITELTSVHGLGTAINSELDQDRLLNLILQSVAKGLNYDQVFLLLVSERGETITYGRGFGIDTLCEERLINWTIDIVNEPQSTVLVEILKDGLMVVQNPLHMNKTGFDGLLIECFREKPFVVQPLIAQGRGIALLLASREQYRGMLGEREKDSLKNLANHASVALENARMYGQSFEKARMEEELKHAREIQIAYSQLEKQNALLQKTMQELKDAQEELLSTSRLAAVGELAGRVAHEVLNPITAIVTRIERMLETIFQDEPIPEAVLYEIVADWRQEFFEVHGLDQYLSRVVEETETTYGEEDFRSMADISQLLLSRRDKLTRDLEFLSFHTNRVIRIVDSLRAMSRSSGGVESVNINEILHDSVELMIDGFSKRNIKVQEAYDPELPFFHANYSEMIQVFSNLLKNSMQAIEETQKSGEIVVETSQSKGLITVRVNDTGAGIRESDIVRVFDPEFSTKSREEGTGLGLSLSRRFIREIGGEITIERSELGRGTTVLVSIPVIQPTS